MHSSAGPLARRGTSLRLTDELADALALVARDGVPLSAALAAAGVSESVFYEWKAIAEGRQATSWLGGYSYADTYGSVGASRVNARSTTSYLGDYGYTDTYGTVGADRWSESRSSYWSGGYGYGEYSGRLGDTSYRGSSSPAASAATLTWTRPPPGATAGVAGNGRAGGRRRLSH